MIGFHSANHRTIRRLSRLDLGCIVKWWYELERIISFDMRLGIARFPDVYFVVSDFLECFHMEFGPFGDWIMGLQRGLQMTFVCLGFCTYLPFSCGTV